MKKLIIFTTLFVLFLVFILPGIAALAIRFVPANDQAPYDANVRRSIYDGFTIFQQFTSPQNNITAIGMSIGNPNLKNKSNIDLVLRDEGGNVIRKSTINGANLPDGALIRFVFDPIADSKGKTYNFELSSSGAGPEEVINVYYATKNESWIGPSTFGKEVNQNGLPIIIYFTVPSRLGIVEDIYSNWLSRLLHLSLNKSG